MTARYIKPAEPDAGGTVPAPHSSKTAPRRPVMIRIPEAILTRIDHAAERLGLSRAAFILSRAIQQLEHMEGR